MLLKNKTYFITLLLETQSLMVRITVNADSFYPEYYMGW